ncbi:cell surface protein, partial [Paraburkholderia sp. CNPSo 3076]|nr:cell surface protein [Paraburkholderia sp. CNPSo 3076]
ANQRQDVANLSRDTTNTNGSVSKLPDVSALLNQQGDRMNAAQAAGQAVAQRIGDYADAQARATGDSAWAEGGSKRAEMQAAGAAVVAGLGGGVGSAVAGAAGAGIGSKMGGELNKLSDSIAASNLTGDANMNAALGNIVANVIATGAGAAAGGAGAFGSSTVDLYNRQLHPDERQWAKDNASKFAQFYKDQTGQTITADQAQQMLLASGYRLVDAAASAGPAPDGNQYATAFISQNGGSMFRAAPTEYNSPFLYGNADHSLSPEQQALPGHDAHPQVGVAAGGALAMVAVGTVSPLLAGAWALNTAYDFSGDAISYLTHTSSDAPNAGKSLIVGGAAAALTPLGLPLDTLGSGIGAKIAVGTYNGLVSATGAFAGGGMVNPSSDPSAFAATSATAYGVGTAAQIWLPGLTGNIANHVVQILSGPAQTKVQNSLNNPNSSK